MRNDFYRNMYVLCLISMRLYVFESRKIVVIYLAQNYVFSELKKSFSEKSLI